MQEEDDYCDILPEALEKAKARGPRISVSAEAFGSFNQKGNFKPKVVPKDEAAKATIIEKMSQAFMFSALDEKEQTIVVNAMEELIIPSGTKIIQQDDEGDCLYVVGSGTLSCTKIFPEKNEPTFLKTYQPGEAFGELALLYNAPR